MYFKKGERKLKKLLVLVLGVFVFVLLGCQNHENVLIVLTSSGYEPYEMVDTNGELTGFDIELMEALAEEAGIEIEWLDVDFNGILASLESGTHEVAIAGITPTPDRLEVLDFSEVYYNSEEGVQNYLIYKNTNQFESLNDLEGLVVGAQLGTIQAELISELSESLGFTEELRNLNSQIIEEIRINSIDALVVESLVADAILEVNTDFKKIELTESTEMLYGNAIAFSKGSQYKAIFDDALEVIKANGTLDELIAKWFEIES